MIASHAKLRKVRKFNKFKERKLKSYIDNLIRRNENCETILRVYWLYRKRGIGLPKHQSSAASWAGVLGAKPSRKTLFNVSIVCIYAPNQLPSASFALSPSSSFALNSCIRVCRAGSGGAYWQKETTIY